MSYPKVAVGTFFTFAILLLLITTGWFCSYSLASGTPSTHQDNKTTVRYMDPDIGYEIQYPSDWKAHPEGNSTVSFIYSNKSLEDEYEPGQDRVPTLNISVTNKDISSQLKYASQETENQLEDELELSGFDDVEIISRAPFTLGELTGTRVTYSFDDPVYGTVVEDKVLLARGDRIYVIDFRAGEDEYDSEIYDDVVKMINSFSVPAAKPLLTEQTGVRLNNTLLTEQTGARLYDTLAALNKNILILNNITSSRLSQGTGSDILTAAKPLLTERTGLGILAALQGRSLEGEVQNTTALSKNVYCEVGMAGLAGLMPSADVVSINAGTTQLTKTFC